MLEYSPVDFANRHPTLYSPGEDEGISSDTHYYRNVGHHLDWMHSRADFSEAGEVEAEILDRLETARFATSDLARAALKAISIAQYARQIGEIRADPRRNTLHDLGNLMEKTNRRIRYTRRFEYGSPEFLESRTAIGALTETAFYSLLSYDATMEHTLTGQHRKIPPHYTLMSTRYEDTGKWFDNGDESQRKGFDMKLFTDNEDELVIPLQLKTSTHEVNRTPYAPGIKVLYLDKITEREGRRDAGLAASITNIALGRASKRDSKLVFMATNNLDDELLK